MIALEEGSCKSLPVQSTEPSLELYDLKGNQTGTCITVTGITFYGKLGAPELRQLIGVNFLGNKSHAKSNLKIIILIKFT